MAPPMFSSPWVLDTPQFNLFICSTVSENKAKLHSHYIHPVWVGGTSRQVCILGWSSTAVNSCVRCLTVLSPCAITGCDEVGKFLFWTMYPPTEKTFDSGQIVKNQKLLTEDVHVHLFHTQV
eukprot:TRINITY_DN67131_c5_g8_i1.p1 TRINITY_DN67131_c5_g8~~TRINITY_DN67131_c5_g8_i1.p1  ORF type:complete len:122 (+),score=3.11 TRINITY_DN67131_c5_g8_i1:167-532(+)